MSINYKIKDICKNNGITLTELGIKLGKSKQYMSELSNGNIKLSYEMAIKIAAIFNKKPDEIFLT